MLSCENARQSSHPCEGGKTCCLVENVSRSVSEQATGVSPLWGPVSGKGEMGRMGFRVQIRSQPSWNAAVAHFIQVSPEQGSCSGERGLCHRPVCLRYLHLVAVRGGRCERQPVHDRRIRPGSDRLCLLADRPARYLHPSRPWPACKKPERDPGNVLTGMPVWGDRLAGAAKTRSQSDSRARSPTP